MRRHWERLKVRRLCAAGGIGANYDFTANSRTLEVNDSNKKTLVNTAISLLFFRLGGGLKPLINSMPASNSIRASSDLFFSTAEQTTNRGYDEKHK